MRIVLDTNVFISGVFFSGPPFQILKAWRDEKVHLVISQEILEEYQRVGEDPDDDKFLACAMAGKTKFVISGDKQLLKVSDYRGVKIITPRKFVDEYL